jgi:hypothetical protein
VDGCRHGLGLQALIVFRDVRGPQGMQSFCLFRKTNSLLAMVSTPILNIPNSRSTLPETVPEAKADRFLDSTSSAVGALDDHV